MSADKERILASIESSLAHISKTDFVEVFRQNVPFSDGSILFKMKIEWERNGGYCYDPLKNFDDLFFTLSSHFGTYPIGETIAISSALKPFETILKQRFPHKRFFIENGLIDQVNCSICIATAGIVENGTILVHWDSTQSRSIAVLPEHVIYLLNSKNIYETMDDAFNALRLKGISGWVMIGGPSRTADIEKVLVTGVHGPKFVSLLILEEEFYDRA
ncbi:MAG: LUD domain-containing protein [bacterium]|nr:LUD domain-containing protein [bacterium]